MEGRKPHSGFAAGRFSRRQSPSTVAIGEKVRIFATCAPGLEAMLAEELRRLGATRVKPGSRGVEARGGPVLLWRANVESRLAERILVPLGEGRGGNPTEVHRTAMGIDWSRVLPKGSTFAIDASVASSTITHRIFFVL